jgi:hypothetical protein
VRPFLAPPKLVKGKNSWYFNTFLSLFSLDDPYDVMANEAGDTVTISVRRPTNTSPVFVAGTFTSPAWEPFELTAKPIEATGKGSDISIPEYVFSRDFKIPVGQYQYRFRTEPHDSWFHDDSIETGRFDCFSR